jgi:hypothetical protein
MEETQIIMADAPPMASWDPAQLYPDAEILNDFVSIPVLFPRGTHNLYLPVGWVNHSSSRERDRLLFKVTNIVRQTDNLTQASLSQLKKADEEFLLTCLVTEIIGQINRNLRYILHQLLMRVAKKKPFLLWGKVSFTDEEIDLHREALQDASDDDYAYVIMRYRLANRIRREIIERVFDNEAVDSLIRNYNFHTLIVAGSGHADMGIISLAKCEVLWEKYACNPMPIDSHLQVISPLALFIESNAIAYRVMVLVGTEYAREFLESYDFASWRYEDLARFMDLELTYDHLDYSDPADPINVKKERADKVLKKLLNVGSEPQLTWFNKGDSVSFQITLKTDDLSRTNLEDIKDYAKGLKEMRGGAHNVKVADLTEEIRKELGRRYVELLDILGSVKRDAQTLSSLSDNWRELILKKYPLLKEHPDLIEGFNLQGEVDTWQVCIEIAARETIPGYRQWEKKPTPNTLRTAAILPDQAA